MKKEYYRPSEIEQAFGIPAVTARYYFHAGILKGAKIGSIILINGDDLRARLAQVEAGAPSDAVFYAERPATPQDLFREHGPCNDLRQ
jgi:hypothetical protein